MKAVRSTVTIASIALHVGIRKGIADFKSSNMGIEVRNLLISKGTVMAKGKPRWAPPKEGAVKILITELRKQREAKIAAKIAKAEAIGRKPKC